MSTWDGTDAYESYDLRKILKRIRRPLMRVAVVSVIAGASSALVIAIRPSSYQVKVVLTTVGSSRATPGLGVASSLLGGALNLGGSSFSATPAVVSYLLSSRSVLDSVGRLPFGTRTLAEAVTGEDLSGKDADEIVEKLRALTRTIQSKETNFIVLTITSRDSGAARRFAGASVSLAQQTFSSIQQAQGRQLRVSQQERLDSSLTALRAAENDLVEFEQANRIISPGTYLSVQRERLARAVGFAQQAYQNAVNDRQAASALALENAPAVAVVEPPPRDLLPAKKQLLLRGVLISILTAILLSLVVFARELLRLGPPQRKVELEA